MSYYSLLGLDREPFSTSPDPSFLFLSREHKAAFCRLQIAVTLRRGLSVILGDVGMGKTTLSRKFSQTVAADSEKLFFMILNPAFRSERQFLGKLSELFHLELPERASGIRHMEAIEKYLFRQGVEEGKTVVLLVDEAQMLPKFALETLRILLNYETNEYKLLQLVLVGQMELLPKIRGMRNFWDRIALRYMLNPLGEDEVREMVDFRLRQAGYKSSESLFTEGAVRRVWEFTKGYPRRVALCCHDALESLVMFDRGRVDETLVQGVIERLQRAEQGHVSAGESPDLPVEGEVVPKLKVRYGG